MLARLCGSTNLERSFLQHLTVCTLHNLTTQSIVDVTPPLNWKSSLLVKIEKNFECCIHQRLCMGFWPSACI